MTLFVRRMTSFRQARRHALPPSLLGRGGRQEHINFIERDKATEGKSLLEPLIMVRGGAATVAPHIAVSISFIREPTSFVPFYSLMPRTNEL